MDPLERASKGNNDVELGEGEDVGDEAIIVASATSSISSVTPIQQNLPLTCTPIQPAFSESSNKTSRGHGKKWRKCWKIAEIKEFKKTSKSPNQYKFRRRKISAKLTRESEETG